MIHNRQQHPRRTPTDTTLQKRLNCQNSKRYNSLFCASLLVKRADKTVWRFSSVRPWLCAVVWRVSCTGRSIDPAVCVPSFSCSQRDCPQTDLSGISNATVFLGPGVGSFRSRTSHESSRPLGSVTLRSLQPSAFLGLYCGACVSLAEHLTQIILILKLGK